MQAPDEFDPTNPTRGSDAVDDEFARTALDLLTSSSVALQDLGPDVAQQVTAASGWSRSSSVVGFGIAEKITSGNRSDSLALKVYVEQKLPISGLSTEEVVPDSVHFPGMSSPVPTDVEAIGKQFLQTLSTRQRPVQAGYSIGSVQPATGTLGALVRRTGDPKLYILSNAHVLAESGNAQTGLTILQPGPADSGRDPDDKVAALTLATQFDFSDGYQNLCDAAIAVVGDDRDVSGLVALVGAVQPGPTPSRPLTRGQTVQKTGRTTGHTTGVIKDLDYRTFVTYPKSDGSYGSVGFRSQVLCERYSDSGDSGSLVLDDAGVAIGLHWCGSTATSVFSPIEFVLEALGVTLVTVADLNPDGSIKEQVSQAP
jgi:Trypsin